MRRFGPLLVILVFSVVTLLVRLWDVQVTQHEVWAAESVNLVRSHAVEPYVRGAIRDRHGRLLVHDEKVYALEFVWRDFRRGHPLGQVAMMRSLAKMRPVGLDEARVDLVDAALAYARLSPADLDAFSRGEALDVGIDYVPAIAAENERDRRRRAGEQRRRSRAGDLRFYIQRLLDLDRAGQRRLRDLLEDEDERRRSFADLAGIATARETAEVESNLITRVETARRQLERLAPLIDMSREDPLVLGVDPAQDPLAALVAIIEDRRREVEDDAADELFRIAAGFAPQRLSTENLERFDLDWLAAALDWDLTRLGQWRERCGSLFAEDSATWIAGHTIARSKLGIDLPADRVLSALAHAFRVDPDGWSRESPAPEDWRRVDRLEVLATLPDRLEGGRRARELCEAPVLPFQRRSAEQLPDEDADLIERILGEELAAATAAVLESAPDPEERSRLARRLVPERLVTLAGERAGEWRAEDERWVARILACLNGELQERIARVLDEVAGAGGTVVLRESHVEKAQETRRYVVRDRGARARQVGEEPEIDLVLLVTRYPEAFAGFRVTRLTRRVRDRFGPDPETPLAFGLLGRVRTPILMDILEQRPRIEELARLRRKLRLPQEDEERILELVDESHQPGQSVGGSGLEAWFDRELSGVSGVIEVQGLQDRVEGNRDPIYRGARDGEDVHLTLDADLQLAAEEVLAHPVLPDYEESPDHLWFERPVGALVLATVDGQILAAASVPVTADLRDDRGARILDGQQRIAIDRTLRRPTAQPPGSVVKPLVAAYALEYLGLRPDEALYYCDADRPRLGTDPKRNDRPGWGRIDCNVRWGHSRDSETDALAMGEALMCSCNVYFAGVAEELYGPEDMRRMYALFGLGRPSGIRSDREGRHGIVEEWQPTRYIDPDPESPSVPTAPARQFLGNGLSYVDANVVQIARAYAALATGHLPDMTLVRRVGDRPVPRRIKALEIREAHLERVREALHDVVHRPGGTAYEARLRVEDLGFSFSAKTGTADLDDGYGMSEELKDELRGSREFSRKHGWIAGWFPSDDPRYVLTVYCHNTSEGAGHTAAHVARQFLTRPEVQALVEDGQ